MIGYEQRNEDFFSDSMTFSAHKSLQTFRVIFMEDHMRPAMS